MSGKSSTIPLCDTHHDNVALAFCCLHKQLLCLRCLVESKNSSECFISEIGKITDDRDKTLYEWVLVRQMAKKKKRMMEKHLHETEILKNTLKQEVSELHGMLVTRLNDMKEFCLKSIDNKAGAVIARNDLVKKQLDALEEAISENLEKVFTDDLSDIRFKLNDVKTKQLNKIPDITSAVEGQFQPNKYVKDFVQRTEFVASLGDVYLAATELYTEIDESELDQNEHEPANVNPDLSQSQMTVCLSSDEERCEVMPEATQGGIFKRFFTRNMSDQSEGQAKDDDTDVSVKDIACDTETKTGFFRTFSKRFRR